MPTVYLLSGVPAAGKTTWIAKNSSEPWVRNCIYLSSDSYVDDMAKLYNTTYQNIFDQAIGHAIEKMNQAAETAFRENRDIIWDQTHTTRRSRQSKLKMIPSHYHKISLFFPMPSKEEWIRRLDSRPDKTIPPFVLNRMVHELESPTTEEGFDEIWTIQS